MEPEAFPKIEVVANPLRKLGGVIVSFFSMHQLASHGEHFVADTLATPVRPVTELPNNTAVLLAQEERMRLYWSGWEDAGKPPLI